ncbi:MAG: alpha/beta fold hydrolase [Caldilineaceae bacterium]
MAEFRSTTGSIYYELLGEASASAPKITLLHNFMSTGRMAWNGILPKLEGFQILLADLPGHGRSVGHPDHYDYSAMGKQITELMRRVGFERSHLAGCSAGGMIAQLMVNDALVDPASLTLVSTTYTTDPAELKSGTPLAPENFVASDNWLDATAKLHDPYQGEGYFYRELLPGFRTARLEFAINLSLDELKRFQLPTCIIHGELDEFFPTTIAQQMHQAIATSELHIIPQQTHALIFRKPWIVGEIMREFLVRK